MTPRELLAVPARRSADPAAWARALAHGCGVLAVIGPASGVDRTEVADGLAQLAAAGARTLGHVSLGYGIRGPDEVRAEIMQWARRPVAGVFLDHAPAGPFQLGPVVTAVRGARREGLRLILLNPGVAVDPAYRRLDAIVCTFDGSWLEYAALPAGRCQPGDAHLVHGVPASEQAAARELAASRGAGVLLVTERPVPLFGPPAPPAPDTALRRPPIAGQRRGAPAAHLTA